MRDRSLLWSVRVLPVPSTMTYNAEQHLYAQAIWVWAFPLNEDAKAMIDSIINVCSAFTEEYLDLCTSVRCIDSQILPFAYDRDERIVERFYRESEAVPLETDEAGINELDLAKAYEVTERVQKALVEGWLAQVELPFVLSAEETALVHTHESAFVIGRSGTVRHSRSADILSKLTFAERYRAKPL